MTRRVLSEADIDAYLDGELSARERDDFEALLDADPALVRRLDQLRDADRQLRAALDPVAGEGVPAAMLETLFAEPARGRSMTGRAAAAALAIFILGAAAGWSWNGFRDRPDLVAENTAKRALDAHLVYVSEVRHPVEVGADQYDHLVGWLSKRLGQPLMTPDFSKAGFKIIGGRLLPGDKTAAAQFMYEREAGERLTLYVAQNPDARQTAFRLAENDNLRTFYWLDGPLGYAISGELDEATLLGLAHVDYEQLSPNLVSQSKGT
ncbi:MAG: anti-sigma factor family protein [Alphaproteobacteria bacterium]